jgi:phage/plasmid-associated DNA primase
MNNIYNIKKSYTPSNINKKEQVDTTVLRYLLLNPAIIEKYEDSTTKGKLFTILKKYNKECKNGYLYTEYEQKHPNLGRYYVKGSGLQFLKKEIRDSLTYKYHNDIDIINCHPTLLYNICMKNNWKCDILKSYVENRESKLQELVDIVDCTPAEAKKSINIVINNGEFSNPKFYTNELWLQHFAQELTFIKQEIYTKYTQYSAIANKKRKENKIGSTMSLFLGDIENQCILALDDFLTNKGYDVQVLMFDGLQISNQHIIDDNILKEAEDFIFEKTEMKIKLKNKKLECCIDIDEDDLASSDELINDDFACSVFYDFINEKIVSCRDSIIVFDDKTGLWCNDERILWKYVHQYRKQLVFKKMTMLGEKTYDYGGNKNNIKNMLCFLSNYCEIEDNFWNNNLDTSKGKLLFKNGIYDFNTNTFTEGFNKDIVFKSRINRNFEETRNEEDIKYVHKSLFEDPFLDQERKEMSIYLKIALARGISGDYLYKICYFIIGLKDSCKGVLYEALKNCFEGYISSFNGASLYYNKNNTDEAKKLSWILDICDSRITFASEPRSDSTIDTNLLKTISSGGDPIICRKNFKDELEIKNRATAFILCNDAPQPQPVDEAVTGRLNYIELKCRFIPEKDITNTKYQRVANENIKLEFKQEKYKNALLHILIDSYQEYLKEGHTIPDDVLKAKDDWLDNDFSLKTILQKRYEITNDKKDYIPISEINDYLDPHRNKLKMSDRKIGLEITNVTGYSSDVKTITINNKKKSIRVRYGIKEKVEEIVEEDKEEDNI